MYETNYHRPVSVVDAVNLAGTNEEAKFLAGGQTLLPTMKQRLAAPSDVIDLGHIADLKGIDVSGDVVTIGAAVTHAEVAASSAVVAAIPALADLASHIGDPHVRNRGTLGGSVANNDPAADYPSAVLALNATVHTDKRAISADDFFTGMFDTALEEGELITKISFNAPSQAAYAKFANPASRYAMAGVFVAVHGGFVRVAVTGAGSDGVFRWAAAEEALAENLDPSALSGLSVDEGDMLADIHGSSAYRANLVSVMAKRAVAAL